MEILRDSKVWELIVGFVFEFKIIFGFILLLILFSIVFLPKKEESKFLPIEKIKGLIEK